MRALSYVGYILVLAFAFSSQMLLGAQESKEVIRQQIAKSEAAAKDFLNLIDKGRYDASWEAAAPTLQQTVQKTEWVRIMEASRKPLGSVLSRTLEDVRKAVNPQGLPQGQYMVFIYKTNFENKQNVTEIITLQEQSGGSWKVLTYQNN